ncbi:MAG: sensor histidine kinase N-terminal domain-containing protein [Proteobacteria bacterium]|nr:sensor histidine kinase N-terminal domain-containing protein [Pseudomonadota bacterium]
MKRFSIQRRLLLLLIGSLVLAWGAMLAAGYGKARAEIHELADARLQQGARTLMALDLKRLARLAHADAAMPIDADADADHDGSSRPLAFQAWGDNGQLLLASAGAPAATFWPDEGYATRTIDGRDWRSYTLRDRRHEYRVSVLEPLALREHPVHELAWRMGQVLLWALPLLAALVWISIRRGLEPLARLSDAIGLRDAGNLEPIRPPRIPAEAETVVAALNRLLERLAHSLDKERAFTADAAHELRTPLAAIKVQAEVALGARDEESRRRAIGQVIAGVDRSTHLAEQLLLLARLEHADAAAWQPVDLGRVAADVVARRAGEAAAKGLDVEVAAAPDCTLPGDPATLAILLDNLLDNAIKYGKDGGHIRVGVRRDPGAVSLSVVDDGEGVGAADRARLRDRFFRVAGSAAPGSGLGLSIVEKIAVAHGGVVEFDAGLEGRGLGVSVRFDAPQAQR